MPPFSTSGSSATATQISNVVEAALQSSGGKTRKDKDAIAGQVIATAIANKLNVDVSQLPVVATAPEAAMEKAVSIGTWAVALDGYMKPGSETCWNAGSSVAAPVIWAVQNSQLLRL